MLHFLYIFFSLFFIIISLFFIFSLIFSYRKGAPFVPVEKKYLKDIIQISGINEGSVFCDLGSGDGRALMAALKAGAKKCIGVEISYLPFLLSKVLTHKRRKNIQLVRGNMFELSESMIREVNCFYIYLFPEIVEKLSKSVFLKAKKGTKIIAVSFGIKAEYSDDFKLVLQRKIGWHNIYIYEKIR